MPTQGLLTVKELSSYLGVSTCTIRRLVKNRDILFIRRKGIGIRFRREQVDEWLRKSSYSELSKAPEPRILTCDTIPPKGGNLMARVRNLTLAKNGEFLRGTVYRRETKKGGRWCLNFQAKGRRIRKVIPFAQTEQEALVALQEENRKEFDREYSIRREKQKLGFREFADTYLTNYAKLKKRSWRTDEKYLNSQLIPFFGEMELGEISSFDVQKFMVKRQGDGVRNSTINRELTVLKKMLGLAIKWGYCITANPVEKGNYFSEEEYKRDRVASYEEECRLFPSAASHLKPILKCALMTMMRHAEVLGLTWDCVDLEKGQITVKAKANKSGKKRVIPINETLHAELDRLKKLNKATSDFVFLYEDPKTGKLRPVKTVRRAFVMACRRAGIKNLRFHDLRHTAGTRLIESGADPISVRDIMGHANLKTTERYLHSSFKRMEAAVRLLDKPQAKDLPEMSPECHQKSSGPEAWKPILLLSRN